MDRLRLLRVICRVVTRTYILSIICVLLERIDGMDSFVFAGISVVLNAVYTVVEK